MDIKISLLVLLVFTFFTVHVGQDVALSSLTASKGFRILGAAADDESGYSVRGAGDVNGDGIKDVIVGAHFADPSSGSQAGISYVIFGRSRLTQVASPFSDVQLTTGATTMAASVGFRMLGAITGDESGFSVSGAGDVNGDGVGDVVVGAYQATLSGKINAGISYVIFGRNLSAPGAIPFGDIQLTAGTTALAASTGFRMLGDAAYHRSGYFVSAGGDVNGDGIDDVLIGSRGNNGGADNAGITYVIFGRSPAQQVAHPFGDIVLTNANTALASGVGFRVLGAYSADYLGWSLGAAGDVNGDSVDDIIMGARWVDLPTGTDTGASYVIFGRSQAAQVASPFVDIWVTGWTTPLPVNIGFRLLGAAPNDESGNSVSGAGDVNNDGIDDVIVGAYYADQTGDSKHGISYVIFGRNIPGGAVPFGDIQLTTWATALAPSTGFRILGSAANDCSGYSVSAAGDMNGDGIDDLLIGAYLADPPSKDAAGVSYVIFGRDIPGGATPFADIQLTTGSVALSPRVGYRILGAQGGERSGYSVSAAGDVNGDGLDDIIIGAMRAAPLNKIGAGLSYVVYGAYPSPTSQPSSQPSRQPSRQPTQQPTRQPSRQPSSQPSLQPTVQPSMQPSVQPTSQPTQPTSQPSMQPSQQPTTQPSRQPTRQPSSQPSRQPSAQPTYQPNGRPSCQPSSQPSRQPSLQPSNQPSGQPSCFPSGQPSTQPSNQPFALPSNQPSGQPSVNPSSQPSCQPSSHPSSQPTQQPSDQPSSQPSRDPSGQPSTRPSPQPSGNPSSQPSNRPSKQPSSMPSLQPSKQPTSQPSCQPSSQPSSQLSGLPSMQPSVQPSTQPSAQSSSQPSSQPSAEPSVQPSTQPSTQPSLQPSVGPSGQPTIQPSIQPSASPSQQPSTQPSCGPTSQPSGQPSHQPLCAPTSQPSASPTSSPTADLETGEWATILYDGGTLTYAAFVNGDVWVCGVNGGNNEGSYCASLDSALGVQTSQFSFRWTEVTTTLQATEPTKVVVGGRTVSDHFIKSDIAVCLPAEGSELSCIAKSFEDTDFAAGSYVPFADKIVFVGATQSIYASVSIMDGLSGAVHSYVYRSTAMSSISLLKVHSPPSFIGGFVAGTCVSTTSVNCIYAGVVRTDSGILTGMYLKPSSASILNSADLVNAMALEYEHPDSFIAGGLQLNDGAGMQAYLVCVNLIYRRVIYGMRYILRETLNSDRRLLVEQHASTNSVVKGMVRVEKSLFLLVNLKQSGDFLPSHSMEVLKIDKMTGSITQQVHIYSNNASIQCSDITSAGSFLILTCAVQYHVNITQAVVLSVSSDVAFSKLPNRFMRRENTTFEAVPFSFKGTVLPLTMSNDEKTATEYSFNTADGHPTLYPSVAPTVLPSSEPTNVPSGQPSSSPTAAPSVSPQPTSQPSTSGPTNTYKPTAKPTQHPSARPSVHPTTRPSRMPSRSPTARPSVSPSARPSNCPSASPSTTRPTLAPSAKPTRQPTVLSTRAPTAAPSVTPTIAGTSQKEQKRYRVRESAILGYSVAGLLGFLFLYQLYRWCIYKVRKVKEDKKRVKEMVAQDLPGKSRYPLFSAAAGLCCTIDVEELEDSTSVNKADVASPSLAFVGQGAFVDSPGHFVDLESNVHVRNVGDDGDNNSAERKGNPKMEGKKEEILKSDPLQPLTSTAIVNTGTEERAITIIKSNTHEKSYDVNDVSNASADEENSSLLSSDAELERDVPGTSENGRESFYSAVDSEDYEPSDDSEVVYSISSDEEVHYTGNSDDANDMSDG